MRVFIGGSWLLISLALLAGCSERDKITEPPVGNAPTVDLTAPGNNATVSGTIDLTATATGADRVVFFIDQNEVGRDDTSPYSVSWNSTTVTAGAHTVKAVAENANGNSEDQASITVENGLPSTEIQAIQGGFALGNVSTSFANDAVAAVSAFVFIASGLNSNQLTLTGTLTQTQENVETFSYSATPSDRLVVDLKISGTTVTLTFFVTAFEGDLSGDSTDFERFHSNLAFRVTRDGQYDLTLTSASGTPPGIAPQTNIAYQRHLTGTRILTGVTYTVNVTLSGSLFFEVDGQFAQLDRRDFVSGSVSGGGLAATLDESSRGIVITNAGEGRTVQNSFRNLNDTLTVGGATFGLSQIAIQTELTNGRIAEPEFWQASGSLIKNGATIGTLRFASTPVGGGSHPGLVFALAEGGTIPL